MFPGDIPGSPRVQNKSHVPKIMIIVVNVRPDPTHNFDGKIGIWRICVMKTAQRSSKRRKEADEYEFDCTIDAEWHKNWYIEKLLPAIKTKMPWLRSKRVVVQQDGATPHTGKDNPEILNSAGMGRGWLVELKTQPSQSPDLNVNDLGFFASLKSRVWRASASSVDELVQNVFDQYEEYDGDTLERVWQSLFKVYNQTLRKLGDNDFRVEHTGVGKRQRDGTLETVVKYDAEAFSAAWHYLADSDKEDSSRFYFYFLCVFSPPEKGRKTVFFGTTGLFSAAGTCRRLHKKRKKTEFNSKNDEDLKNTITFGIGHG